MVGFEGVSELVGAKLVGALVGEMVLAVGSELVGALVGVGEMVGSELVGALVAMTW